MQRQSTNPLPLDYLRTSPVRGQLEPPDPRTAKGWRYIQTTDTLNQLKVLLPPGTASMYEQLLKFEAFELGKKSTLSWERIVEIRHLKDRMIRKCQKLAKLSPLKKPSDTLTFRTLVAPPDFRVKEMEKWFQEQQKRTNALLRRPHTHPAGIDNPHYCSRCAESAVMRDPSHPTSSSAQVPRPVPESNRAPVHQQPQIAPLASTSLLRAKSSLPSRYKSSNISVPLPRRSVSSPPPLPHLLRVRNLETGYDLSDDPQKIVSMPTNVLHVDHNADPNDSNSSDESPSIPAMQVPTTSKGDLRRRPSCIKRSSTGDLTKRVSWADNHDLAEQVSKYVSAAYEAKASGHKWEEIRGIYVEQIDSLETLHQQVARSLVQLQAESEHLKRADEIIRSQREALTSTFQDFEKKQMQFQTKVLEALEDANHILSLGSSTAAGNY